MNAAPTGGDGTDTLARRLARRIALEGPLTVAAFMAEALGHPTLGYYTTRDPFGEGGDFVTAPEVSQMFGELIGLWCIDLWARMGGPSPVRLVELGPGRGTLMADALRAASLVPDFRNAVAVHLVETSPVLRERQRRTLAPFPLAHGGVRWHDRLEDVPDGPALVIANEFFDALPIRQLQKTEHGWTERLVDVDPESTHDDPRFRFVLEAFGSPAAGLAPERLAGAAPGSVFEICPAAEAVARSLAARLATQGGAALVIDYGHGRGPALGETLQAVRRHAFAPVLEHPGEADLTAHVDFTAIAAAARAAGAESFGPVDQRDLLLGLGILQRADALKRNATPPQAAAIDAALDRLLGPDGMGTLFKALAIATPGLGAPAGFG
ncbi:class I SAM-dependent methyltransferase [Azospirillum sp. RWY-5-1]|uniref:Class I SAM-dependent methyltransferase n=1 Tax=Azospirillum oleiclasticum TaxID=2735135 RepID=A0ABX2TBI4_9PROT|nr:class I SAM-dependent methyltransferase [Azospirillum oleiclasticum]NYZ14129.1 class I SAM-dependent methyltransferase [Azospirillum oleiclasticum]NYZ21613.1 class I SAM-dependent methyltransferase [Azospirillum oleiclasticum]